MAARSKALVCGRSFVGIVGSNLAEDVDICPLRTMCVFNKHRSLRQADHPCKGVLQIVVCPNMILNSQQ